MKRMKMRTLVAVCLALALAAGTLTMFSLAGVGDDPDVVFDAAANGGKGGFEIKANSADDGDGHRYVDLFDGKSKNMMPGDEVSQDITVEAKNLKGGQVVIGLRSDPTNTYTDGNNGSQEDITKEEQEAYQKLLESGLFTLTVEDDSLPRNAWTVENLEKGVSLGKFLGERTKTTLTLKLSLSPDAGNELADLHAAIGWVFTAQYEPASNPPPSGPNKPALDKGGHYAYIIGYDDGLVHPEALITRAETVTIFFRMLQEESRREFWSQSNPYYDVFPEDWFNNAISTLTRAQIVNGYPNGNFGPMDNITRAEFATMAVRFFTDEAEDIEITKDYFPDISDTWANYEINLAYALGLVVGTPEGNFEPDREITRAEAVTIVNRVLERYPDKDHLLEDMIVWPDNMDEDMWYYADMQEATNSHDYEMNRWTNGDPYEIWKTLLEVRDWAALEREWSEYNSSYNPGEVVSSRNYTTP